MRLLEIGLPYSVRLQYYQRWRFFLTFGSKTQKPLSQMSYLLVVILKLSGVSEIQYKEIMIIDNE